MPRVRTQSSFLVDRREINCIGIERTVQNCSYSILESHTLLNSMHVLAHVNCRGQFIVMTLCMHHTTNHMTTYNLLDYNLTLCIYEIVNVMVLISKIKDTYI